MEAMTYCCNKNDLPRYNKHDLLEMSNMNNVTSELGLYGYMRLNTISRGSYGIVHRALNIKTGEIVAVKQELQLGLSKSTLTEISILRSLPRHPSIVEFKDVVTNGRDHVYVVMEHLETDLNKYIDAKEKSFSISEVKYLMKRLLEGVKYLHEWGVMHRDLKPSNILMNKNGDKLKICDFGLSRLCESSRVAGSYTQRVGTLWYKAPELLLGAKKYSSAIDMWSVGCIMAELLLKEVLFEGRSEIEQLSSIQKTLGVQNNVASSQNLLGNMFEATAGSKVPYMTTLGLDLLNKLLAYDPNDRITAEDALRHGWFAEFDSFFYREYDSYFC